METVCEYENEAIGVQVFVIDSLQDQDLDLVAILEVGECKVPMICASRIKDFIAVNALEKGSRKFIVKFKDAVYVILMEPVEVSHPDYIYDIAQYCAKQIVGNEIGRNPSDVDDLAATTKKILSDLKTKVVGKLFSGIGSVSIPPAPPQYKSAKNSEASEKSSDEETYISEESYKGEVTADENTASDDWESQMHSQIFKDAEAELIRKMEDYRNGKQN